MLQCEGRQLREIGIKDPPSLPDRLLALISRLSNDGGSVCCILISELGHLVNI